MFWSIAFGSSNDELFSRVKEEDQKTAMILEDRYWCFRRTEFIVGKKQEPGNLLLEEYSHYTVCLKQIMPRLCGCFGGDVGSMVTQKYQF